MTPNRFRSLTLRLAVAAGLWTTLALVAGGVALTVLVRNYIERSFDSQVNVVLESLIGNTQHNRRKSQILITRPLVDPRFEQPYSGWYWQVNGVGQAPLRSRSLWDQSLPVSPGLPAEDPRFRDVNGPDQQILRLAERDIVLPGSKTPVHLAVAVDRAEIDQPIKRMTMIVVWSFVALGVGVLTSVVVQIRYGLRPLRRIESALAAVRSGSSARLGEDFPSEILPLVRELNALVAHDAEVLERTRTHVGNLAHALKTPLSVIGNEAARDHGPLAETVRQQSAAMKRHIDHHLARARAAGSAGVLGARAPVAEAAEDLRRALLRVYADRELTIDINIPEHLNFRGARQDLDELLGNLMDNACKWAKHRLRVTAHAQPNRPEMEIAVEDDGPGLTPEQMGKLTRRGARLDESVPGTGLGLAIVRDIATLNGGQLTLGRADIGGLKAMLTLPVAT